METVDLNVDGKCSSHENPTKWVPDDSLRPISSSRPHCISFHQCLFAVDFAYRYADKLFQL